MVRLLLVVVFFVVVRVSIVLMIRWCVLSRFVIFLWILVLVCVFIWLLSRVVLVRFFWVSCRSVVSLLRKLLV